MPNKPHFHTNMRLMPQLKDGGFMTIIKENPGIYKKPCVQMVCNGDGLGSVLCVCFLKATPERITRAVSKHSATMRNVFSQQGVVGLLSASQLSLNVSLTNRAVGLHGTADNTATFNFYSLIPPPPPFSAVTAPLNGKEEDRRINYSAFTLVKTHRVCRWTCVEVNAGSVCFISGDVCRVIVLFALTHTGLLEHIR